MVANTGWLMLMSPRQVTMTTVAVGGGGVGRGECYSPVLLVQYLEDDEQGTLGGGGGGRTGCL